MDKADKMQNNATIMLVLLFALYLLSVWYYKTYLNEKHIVQQKYAKCASDSSISTVAFWRVTFPPVGVFMEMLPMAECINNTLDLESKQCEKGKKLTDGLGSTGQ